MAGLSSDAPLAELKFELIWLLWHHTEPDVFRHFEPEDTPVGVDDGEDREPEDTDEEQENGSEPHSEDEALKEHDMFHEEPDDPELNELNKRLEVVTQSGDLKEMRNLHQELHERHVLGRRDAVRRVTKLI